MSRRSNNKNENILFLVIAIITIYFVSVLIQFILDNLDFIMNLFLIILGIGFIYAITKSYLHFDKVNRYKRKVNRYKRTDYYKDTLIPYNIIENNKGLQFEVEVFNHLKKKFSNCLLLTNLLIARKGSINEYSEIDMIFFHQTGLYVLELKNYSGFVYGELNKEKWTVGYKKDERRSSYEFLNPISQNKKHIEDLEKMTKFEYINHVIFSDNTEIDSYIDNVSNLNNFIDMISKKETIYNLDELKEAYEEIKRINTYEKLSKHLERIKFNEQKYSHDQKK
jgi:hypothetical protein